VPINKLVAILSRPAIMRGFKVKAVQVFLSYAREDEEKVGILYQKLSQKGFKPWMDQEDILPGEKWKIRIQRAIRDSDFFLACLSANSINKRGFLQREIKDALDIWQEKLDSDIYLIPVRLERCDVPENLHDFQWVNIFEKDGWERLLEALEVGLKRQRRENTSTAQSTPRFERYPVPEEPASGREMATPKEGPAVVQQRNLPPLVWIILPALLVLLVLAAIVAGWLYGGNGQPISTPKAAAPLVDAQPTPAVPSPSPVLVSPMLTPTDTTMPATPTDIPVSPTPTDTPLPPTLTDTPVPSTPTDTPVPPTPTPTHTLTPEPTVPIPAPGITAPILQFPADGDSVAAENPTNFKWQWNGILQEGWGFEVLIWQEKEDPHYGAYDARELTEKLLKHQADGTYTASFKVEAAQSVTQHRASDYYWSVVVVQLDPKYERIGSEAPPHKLHISIGGGEEGGPGSKPPPP
jgi:hypothetical protein